MPSITAPQFTPYYSPHLSRKHTTSPLAPSPLTQHNNITLPRSQPTSLATTRREHQYLLEKEGLKDKRHTQKPTLPPPDYFSKSVRNATATRPDTVRQLTKSPAIEHSEEVCASPIEVKEDIIIPKNKDDERKREEGETKDEHLPIYLELRSRSRQGTFVEADTQTESEIQELEHIESVSQLASPSPQSFTSNPNYDTVKQRTEQTGFAPTDINVLKKDEAVGQNLDVSGNSAISPVAVSILDPGPPRFSSTPGPSRIPPSEQPGQSPENIRQLPPLSTVNVSQFQQHIPSTSGPNNDFAPAMPQYTESSQVENRPILLNHPTVPFVVPAYYELSSVNPTTTGHQIIAAPDQHVADPSRQHITTTVPIGHHIAHPNGQYVTAPGPQLPVSNRQHITASGGNFTVPSGQHATLPSHALPQPLTAHIPPDNAHITHWVDSQNDLLQPQYQEVMAFEQQLPAVHPHIGGNAQVPPFPGYYLQPVDIQNSPGVAAAPQVAPNGTQPMVHPDSGVGSMPSSYGVYLNF